MWAAPCLRFFFTWSFTRIVLPASCAQCSCFLSGCFQDVVRPQLFYPRQELCPHNKTSLLWNKSIRPVKLFCMSIMLLLVKCNNSLDNIVRIEWYADDKLLCLSKKKTCAWWRQEMSIRNFTDKQFWCYVSTLVKLGAHFTHRSNLDPSVCLHAGC